MRVKKTAISSIVLLSMVFSIALGAGAGNMRTQAAPPVEPSLQDSAVTPFQAAMQNAVSQRQAQGLAVPESVTYTNQAAGAFDQAPAVQGMQAQGAVQAAQPGVITATTTVIFDTPQQAGYDQWPALSAQDLPPGAVAPSGDPNAMLRALAEENLPGIWNERAYGSEPRRYTITETITYSPGEGMPSATQIMGMNGTTEDILMGFTMSGPDLDYDFHESIDVCIPLLWPPWYKCWEIASVRAGLALNWGFGLRLPAEATMDGPEQLVQGDFVNDFSAALTPSNWSDQDYVDHGVVGHDGNEWVVFIDFFVGVSLKLFGEEICTKCNITLDEDYSADFATPFGTGAYFPIPSAKIPVWEFRALGATFSIFLGIQPLLGSNQISADWIATGDARGSGRIYFTEPGLLAMIGPIQGCNFTGSDSAQIELSTFRYWFNQFLLRFFLNFGIDLFGLGGWDFDISLYTLNLSSWIPEMYLGKHYACDWKFTCGPSGPDNVLTLTAPVVDQKPPVVSIIEPVSRVYDNTETFTVNWTATDDLPGCPGSGIATETGLIGGEPVAKGTVVELLLVGAGTNTFEVEVVDHDGNVGHASVTFNVVTNLDGLIAALDRMCELGWVNKGGICHSLKVKLDQAKKSIGQGKMDTAANQLEAFVHEVDAQNGKALSQRAHDVLLADALYVIRRLVIPDECPDDSLKTEAGMCGCGVLETDGDGDGTPDCIDTCPADPDKIAAGLCGCGMPETDSDNDGMPDCVDICPDDPGKIAAGFCGCGVPETDDDLDGTPNCVDNCPENPMKLEPGVCGCGEADTDSDSDSVFDCNDQCPLDANKTELGVCGCGVADTDTDNDGTVDCMDLCPLDVNKIDAGLCGCGVPETNTDGDALPDCVDQCWEDPNKTAPGQCGCGKPEDLTDSDSNGIPDCVDTTDTDGDGTYDYLDGCSTDPFKVQPGICGCGVADTDTDGDGVPDCIDHCPGDPTKIEPGVCGCGVADTDTDGDDTPDCNDGCPNDPEKTEPGNCGCGVPETPDCTAS